MLLTARPCCPHYPSVTGAWRTGVAATMLKHGDGYPRMAVYQGSSVLAQPSPDAPLTGGHMGSLRMGKTGAAGSRRREIKVSTQGKPAAGPQHQTTWQEITRPQPEPGEA